MYFRRVSYSSYRFIYKVFSLNCCSFPDLPSLHSKHKIRYITNRNTNKNI